MNPAQTLPIREALRLGWKHTLGNLRPLTYLGLLNVQLSVAQQTALASAPGQSARPLLALSLQLFQTGVWLLYVRWALALCDGRPLIGLADPTLLRGLPAFTATALLYGLIVGFGLVLLVVPGIVWGTRFMFATMLVVDRACDPWTALRESARLTHGVKARLLGFALVRLALNALGASLMGLGLIITLPMTFVAKAHLLRHLQAQTQRVRPASTPLPSPTPV
ncbi:MAG TPA: hypothetical protein VI299_24580 [Polyangiales bacterium]